MSASAIVAGMPRGSDLQRDAPKRLEVETKIDRRDDRLLAPADFGERLQDGVLAVRGSDRLALVVRGMLPIPDLRLQQPANPRFQQVKALALSSLT